MYKILKAEKLAEKIFLMDVEAPRVARSCQPGEFVIVKMDEKGELAGGIAKFLQGKKNEIIAALGLKPNTFYRRVKEMGL